MRVLPLVLALVLALPVASTAATFTEVSPTGNSLSTAILLPSGTDRVLGSISNPGEVDLFKFYLASGGMLTITVNADTPGTFDTNLHFFNGAGNPLGANDDISPSNFNSQLTFSLLPGFYFVAVGENNTNAQDASLNRIQDNDTGVINALGVLAGWDAGGTHTDTYELTFSTPVGEPSAIGMPEPSTLALAAAGLAAVFLRRR